MNSTTKIYTVMCTCSSCTKNAIGRILQNAQIFKRHNNADKLLDISLKNRVNTEVVKEKIDVEIGDVSDTSIDYEDDYSIISAKTTVQSVSFLREDKIFQFKESDVEATSLVSDNDNPNSSDESEDESKVEVASVENLEDMVASTLFGIIFQAFYLVQAGGTAMLKFFRHLLVAFEKDTDLPLTVAVQSPTKFHIQKYTTTPPAYCGNPLFFDPEVDQPISLMVFPYNSLKNSIAQHFAKPGFECQIVQWRSRETINSTLLDIYDGAMWSGLLDKDNEPFFSQIFVPNLKSSILPLKNFFNFNHHNNHDHSLMLTLNVDWFQPFEGRTHASRALYLSMNNLPREERMKPKNIILVGVMPDKLVELYGGITVKTATFPNGTIVCAALMCVACDIPAARKTAGFTEYPSTNDCHKCERHFSVIAGSSKIDYSGFDNESWVPRTKEMNAIYANMWAYAESNAERADLENVWKDLGYLPAAVLVRMQCLADGIIVPPGYTILSAKIESGFPYMKADKWQSWCLIYLLVLLKDALPEKDFKNWTLFVKTCQKLTGPSVTYSEIDSAYKLLGEFGKECEILYGKSSITPNMHLHMHLHESMLDFGPVYAFWLYSFERYNGKLKNIKTNRQNGLDVTFMRVFLEKAFISTFLHAYSTNLLPPMIQFLESIAQVTLVSALSPLPCLENGHPPVLAFNFPIFLQAATNPWYNVTRSEALPPTTLPIKLQPLTMMKNDDYQWLFEFYVKAYQSTSVSFCVVGRIPIDENVFVNNRIQKVKKILLLGQEYCSGEKKKHGSFVRIGGVKRVSTFTFIKWFPAYQFSHHQPLVEQGLELWEKGYTGKPPLNTLVPK
ncbi:hypothetical protein PHYBLDRAFT_139365 [Phycomyces blakesleeanus NRRL 1555(-)]|uniref:Transposase domain-containing protein n=1 Tax=Phycomyces blakesleeanus (strain ATCC 8743b / DSM 1359 / FGSC 10004 / NBRC 33097 / NRRL 1555) TaxID=763407 RepID=A0A162V1A7_PHYB8|nr:hypothetical protein PHYBLDRAFT_139365 [Phycomyces blakesleeanus NRRL 1555(-)]OAD79333.1 hypothetical protein PHYBLDRAFT_139365 [Phycomyces blakesleeanus NRRL 1555(-)]|eukprot:XP_018297373.1 hypothetical protein PHYBLDRAFT_139365 [Phycomyces blakesleeanus NRRL 1555(-)]